MGEKDYTQSIIEFPEKQNSEVSSVIPEGPNNEHLQERPEKDTEVITGDEEMEKKFVPKQRVDIVRKMVSIVSEYYKGRDIYYIMNNIKGIPTEDNIHEKMYPIAHKYLEGISKSGRKTKKYTGLKRKWKLPPPEPDGSEEATWGDLKGTYPDMLVKDKTPETS